MKDKLTHAQQRVLHTFRPIAPTLFKKNFPGEDWRRLDRLTELGFLERAEWGALRITAAGRTALVPETASTPTREGEGS